MKKLITGIVAATALLLVGCGTTKEVKGSGIKGDAPVVKTGKRVLVDYQGATLGAEIPEWVVKIASGDYSQSALSKVMPDLKDKKVFVTIGRGDNLDFVKQWTDLVDVETEVASSLERVAGKAVEATMNGQSNASGKTADPTELQRNIDMYRTSLSNVRFSGLEKVAQYWTETQLLNEDKAVTSDYFEYYAVWTMDAKLFQQQLNKAMENIQETTTEAKSLKSAVQTKLMENMSVAANDSAITDKADSQSVNGAAPNPDDAVTLPN